MTEFTAIPATHLPQHRIDFNGIEAPSRYFLAPMAGITSSPFRKFMRLMGAGIVTSELISSHGIIHECPKTYKLAEFHSMERPVGIQIFGENLEIMIQSARAMEALEPDFIDVNLGCPVPKVVCKGAGSALLRDPVHLGKILSGLKKAMKLPLTIKIRTGWDSKSITIHEVIKAATDAGVSYVAIHGRTREQKYEGLADWNLIAAAKARATIPIIGNGDILTAETALQRLQESGCDGVMIGRGALSNPWIFQEINHLENTGVPAVIRRDYVSILRQLQTILESFYPESYCGILLKKFSSWYSHGMPNSSHFRHQIFNLKDYHSILHCANEFFSQWVPEETFVPELFLKSGHG
ncbi:MAG: tRNA dihydrouridine synthase DusB [Planctomycetota bacterium]